jgi:AAHS family benzoate transporter-like MFS transporter
MLLGMELPHKMNFIAVAIPAIIAAFAVSLIKVNKAEEVAEAPAAVQSSKQRSYT